MNKMETNFEANELKRLSAEEKDQIRKVFYMLSPDQEDYLLESYLEDKRGVEY